MISGFLNPWNPVFIHFVIQNYLKNTRKICKYPWNIFCHISTFRKPIFLTFFEKTGTEKWWRSAWTNLQNLGYVFHIYQKAWNGNLVICTKYLYCLFMESIDIFGLFMDNHTSSTEYPLISFAFVRLFFENTLPFSSVRIEGCV